MASNNAEIRRHADGSIDIAYYVARCHLQRSLAAHRAIARFTDVARRLCARLAGRSADLAAAKTSEPATERTPAPATPRNARKAA